MATPATGPYVPWLTMLYMAGDNELTEEMVLALQTLVGHPMSESKIVAQFDPSGIGSGDAAVRIPRFREAKSLEDHRDKTFLPTEIDTGSPEALTNFINWALTHSSGNMRHMLVLSGHGGGTSEDFLLKDHNAQNALSMKELREALDAAMPSLRTAPTIPTESSTFLVSTRAS